MAHVLAPPMTGPTPHSEAERSRDGRAISAGLDSSPKSWLIDDPMDRERMLDMDRLVAPIRQKSFVVISAALLICGPWLGWWTIIPLLVAGVLFRMADGAI